MPEFRERLWVPLWWWLVVALLVVSVWWVFVLVLPLWVALASAALAGVLLVWACLRLSTNVIVGSDELWAGRAHIELHWLGAIDALDADRTRALLGREADARAFLVMRPYVPTAVRVEIVDPDDPTPYWLVSTRRPHDLATALSARS